MTRDPKGHDVPNEQNSCALLSVGKAAALLDVSDRTLWRQIERGLIPTVRLGRRRLISEHDLRTYVDQLERVA